MTVVIYLLVALPGTLLAISFNAMFAEVVAPEYRGEVVGKRNALLAISMTASTLLSGYLLDQIAFPLNYQIVFVLGGVGALMSTYYIGRLQPVQSPLPSPLRSNGFSVSASLVQFRNALQKLEKLPFGGGAALRSLAHFELLRGRLGLFMAAYLLFYSFMYLGVPIFPLVTVDVLELSDGVISLGSGIFYAAMFLISLRLQKLALRFGHHALLAASAIMMGTYPLIMGVASGPYHYWTASLLGGLVYGVVSASLLNRLMEVVPEGQRAAGMSFHNLALNLGILAGSLAGPGLGEWLGLQDSMFAVAGLRLLAGLLMVFWA
jgi:MFS family permease